MSKLLPCELSAKARREYSRLSLEETKYYETVKKVILQSYNLDATSYLKSFRTMHRTGQATYKMFLTSLQEMMRRYFDAKKASLRLQLWRRRPFKSSSCPHYRIMCGNL